MSSVSGLTVQDGLPRTYRKRRRMEGRSPSLALTSNSLAMYWMSSSVTQLTRAERRLAMWRAKGLAGPPGLPLANRPLASRPEGVSTACMAASASRVSNLCVGAGTDDLRGGEAFMEGASNREETGC